MKSCIIVQKADGYAKYSLVLSATETAADIDKVIAARERARMDGAREHVGAAGTFQDARRVFVFHRRAFLFLAGSSCLDAADCHWYLVFDFELQKRSR